MEDNKKRSNDNRKSETRGLCCEISQSSSKFRGIDGQLMGIYPKDNGSMKFKNQVELDRIINNPDGEFATGLNLSIGIVSNGIGL